MKRTLLFVLLFAAPPIPGFAVIWLVIGAPQDDFAVRRTAWKSAAVRPITDEYTQLTKTRICVLPTNELVKVFGPSLQHGTNFPPTNAVLPLFQSCDLVFSGLHSANSWSEPHEDVYAVGEIGYIEFFYRWNRTLPTTAIFYERAEAGFVPLRTEADVPKRLEWDKTKFSDFKKWLQLHMPKPVDLGLVKVSESKPTRLPLGEKTACLITTRWLMNPPNEDLSYAVNVAKETSVPAGNSTPEELRYLNGTNPIVCFSMDGRYYIFTAQLVK